jgi:hypothetical protein
MALRVLLTEDAPNYGDEAEERLVAAGHDVVRCTDVGAPAFPCAGLIDMKTCPLRKGVVDVTLAVRHVPRTAPARSEDGVLCSLRHHVPVVVARNAASDPFEEWETEAIDDVSDVVEACERAARAVLVEHARIAASVASEVVERAQQTSVEARFVKALLVAVRRVNGRLDVEVRAAHVPQAMKDMIAARVTAALRDFDKDALGIDVGFVDTQE